MKVGDRVRINYKKSHSHGREATIYKIDLAPNPVWCARYNTSGPGYYVDIDGHGRGNETGPFMFERHELIPITKPKEETGTWEETFKGTDFDIRRERVHTT